MASVVKNLVEQIQLNTDSANAASIASTAYGVCSTAADEAAKTVEMTGFTLIPGVTVHIKFTNANTASNAPTLSINNTTAKPIVQYGSTAVGTTAETSGWQAGAVLSLTYDGTSWVRDQGYNTNSQLSIGTGATDAAAGNHVHGNIANDGTITSGNGNRLLYSDNTILVAESGHYASSTKIAINSTSEPTENLYVSGKIQFNIGTNDGSQNKNFIVYGNNEFLSIGGQGIQAYSGAASSTTVNTLYLQASGGTIIVGASNKGSATRTMYGKFDFKSSTGFTYSGMGTATAIDIYRPLWIMGASSTSSLTNGLPVYNTDLAYNTATGTLKIGDSGTISATDYSGTAAKATADASGNTITTTYATLDSPTLTGTPTAPTADNGTNTTQIATTAYVMNTLSYTDAMIFKGTIGAGGTIDTSANPVQTLPATHEAGWTYKVITDGTYAGLSCVAGDLIICMADRATASDADWTRVGTNSTGGVTGPESSTDEAIARFDGATGAIIQNSKITINDDGKITAPHTQSKTDGIHFTYDSNINFYVGVGNNNTNHGLYDVKASKWVLSATKSNHNWQLNGNASTSTSWAAAQTAYVNLASAGTDSTLNGGQNSAQVLKVDGVLGIDNGGTGTSTAPTLGGIVYGGGTGGSEVYACTGAGTTGQTIISNGSSAPAWYGGLILTGTSGSYAATFSGTVTATTFYGGIDNIAETADVARHIWFNRASNSVEQMGQLGYDDDFTYNPSTNALKVGKITFDSTDSYGDAYQPIYWNNGVPATVSPVQYFNWTINANKKGVTLTHAALTEDTFPLAIVVTSGEEYLTGPITWNNAKNGNDNQFKLTIPSALSTNQSVSGYCIVAHGTTITPSTSDVT